MTTQLDWWKGEGGTAYTARNRVDWVKRLPFWSAIVEDLQPKTVLEMGCNAGWNLRAITACGPIEASGIEPNDQARQEARAAGFNVAPDWSLQTAPHDLVFTAGVLIHVPPEELPATMQRIVDASRRHVICIEYEAEREKEIYYLGQGGLLWKRPFGRLYEAMGLTLLHYAHLPLESGFDNCGYWLLEKPAMETWSAA
jgi:hypothetical protein